MSETALFAVMYSCRSVRPSQSRLPLLYKVIKAGT